MLKLALLLLALSVCIDAGATFQHLKSSVRSTNITASSNVPLKGDDTRHSAHVMRLVKPQDFNGVIPADKRTNLGFHACRTDLRPVITSGKICVTGGNLDVTPMLNQMDMPLSRAKMYIKDGTCASMSLGVSESSQIYIVATCRSYKSPDYECVVQANFFNLKCAMPCGGTSGKRSITSSINR
jgi:hypothetical protein